jgi:hypothetical protein
MGTIWEKEGNQREGGAWKRVNRGENERSEIVRAEGGTQKEKARGKPGKSLKLLGTSLERLLGIRKSAVSALRRTFN